MSEIILHPGAAGAHGRVVLVWNDQYLYETAILPRNPKGIPAAIVDAWAENFLGVIDSKFIPGWDALLSSYETFRDRLAIPALANYEDCMADGFLTRRGLNKDRTLARREKRLLGAYDKMTAAIDYLTTFGLDDFEQRIRDSKDAYRLGEALSLALTGDYLENVFGAAVRQWWFLAVSPKELQYQWATDVKDGKWPPEPVFLKDGNKWTWARRHNNLCIQGGCLALEQINVGKVHEDLDTLLTDALRDNYLPPPDSSIRFTTSDSGLIIRTTISIKPT